MNEMKEGDGGVRRDQPQSKPGLKRKSRSGKGKIGEREKVRSKQLVTGSFKIKTSQRLLNRKSRPLATLRHAPEPDPGEYWAHLCRSSQGF